MEKHTTTAMEILATENITNRDTIDDLTKTIADRSPQITTLTNNLLAATEAAAKLKSELATVKRSNGHSGRGSGG